MDFKIQLPNTKRKQRSAPLDAKRTAGGRGGEGLTTVNHLKRPRRLAFVLHAHGAAVGRGVGRHS